MKCPVQVSKRFLSRLMGFLRPKARSKEESAERLAKILANLDAHAAAMWRKGHHLFFLLIQAILIELQGFLNAVAVSDFQTAKRRIDRASTLMLGSGAAMRIAGDINEESYANSIVPSMKATHEKFSGSDSIDHDALVHLYREMEAAARILPTECALGYNRFLKAVQAALGAHVHVCARHRGNERGSTGSGSGTRLTGVETLKRIGAFWLKLLRGKISRGNS